MRIPFTFLLLFSTIFSYTQKAPNFWTQTAESAIFLSEDSEVQIMAKSYQSLSLDLRAIQAFLETTPKEFSGESKTRPAIMMLPMPDGSWEKFQVVQSPVMEPELAVRYPSIKSYKGYGVDDRRAVVRFDLSPNGFNAYIRSSKGDIYIEPYATNQTRYYYCYQAKDLQLEGLDTPSLKCGYQPEDLNHSPIEGLDLEESPSQNQEKNAQLPLRVYRLALSCTGEYGATHGGTVEAVLATMNTAVNLLNTIFEAETSVRMMLIGANDLLIHTNGGLDPFNAPTFGEGLLEQNEIYINGTITSLAYDLGHIFTNGCSDVGGIAGGTICSTQKARGVTCHYTSNLNHIVTRVMAHEIGHQFNSGHTFNNCPNSLDQLASGSAMEPGSGSTIMSYAGSCGNQNIQGGSDIYYNIASLQEFIDFSRNGLGSTCGTVIMTDNNEPEIELPYEDGFYIPISTPFELTASATDEDGDELTYCWEQHDLGPVSPIGAPMANAPIMRSYPPTTEPTRIFPRIGTIVNNSMDLTETLPSYNRDLSFTCAVRDNNPEATATVWEEVKFEATASAGPFLVLYPNEGGIGFDAGDYVEMTWDVANTDNSLVKCESVNILLSTDGGYTYPHMLLPQTDNDGSAFVSIPNIGTNAARIRIEANDNIFFDISDNNFSISTATEPGFTIDVFPNYHPRVCLPTSIEFEVNTSAFMNYDSLLALDLIGDLPEEATYSFSATELIPSENVTLTINFNDVLVEEVFDLQLQAITEGGDTLYRPFSFKTFTSVFSDMTLTEPVDGTSNVLFYTDLTWTPSADALFYEVEIATSPAFGNTVVESAVDILEPFYSIESLLDENTIYYWRVRPVNECGAGAWLPPYAFQTITVSCAPYTPTDVPLNISGTGTPTVESEIFVPIPGIISDVNIPIINGNYQPVNSLRISLVSPAETEVVVFDQNCGNTLNLNLGFDDEAPLELICPPDDGIVFQPVTPLSAFIGEDTEGLWTLRVQVVETGFGASGGIDNWGLEFCASLTPSAPFVITNEPLQVPPGEGNLITKQVLEVQDEDNGPEELEFTLVTPPANGSLLYLGEPLEPGDNFRQSTINSFNLAYAHDGTDSDTDSFTFTVNDGVGGWIPTQTFDIVMDENAVVNTGEVEALENLTLYPNPTDGKLNIQFGQLPANNISVRVFNVQGQEVKRTLFQEAQLLQQLDLNGLTDGLYFITFQSPDSLVTKKVMVGK